MEPAKTKTSRTATGITLFAWFFYPIVFSQICVDPKTWYFFLVIHILYCFFALLAGIKLLQNSVSRESLGPYVVNNEGHILFPGIEVYITEFVNDKATRRYGILNYNPFGESWFVRCQNQGDSFTPGNPEHLRYEPFDGENRYKEEVYIVGSDGGPIATGTMTSPFPPTTLKKRNDELR